MKSKKKLFEWLEQQHLEGFEKIGAHQVQHQRIHNETYGPKSMIYIAWRTPEQRRMMERRMKEAGFSVQAGYWPDSARSGVQVSYFKGHHWEE